jgi:hypothetical protein
MSLMLNHPKDEGRVGSNVPLPKWLQLMGPNSLAKTPARRQTALLNVTPPVERHRGATGWA